MITYHPSLAAGRWYTLTLAEQLGNVGSEYERALRAKANDDQSRFEHAFERMLELLDLTIGDARWKNHRLKELTRVREVVCDELWNEKPEYIHRNDLREYFLYFGILARNQRDKAAKDKLEK
jgi:hypothetical protein